ncbi:MAG: cell division topological specificity factor MinE [Burkholderiaceae bacterium]|nr:cell division topological specificity factor MinE [Burkholderiaceae bacterium]
MSLFSFFFPKKVSSASQAKERLQIVIAREHSDRSTPDYLQDLHRDLIAVITKYVPVSPEDIKISRDRHGDMDVLDVNIVLSPPVKNP